MRLQLIIDLIMHGTSLISIALNSVSIFSTCRKGKTIKKKGTKLKCFFFSLENRLYGIYKKISLCFHLYKNKQAVSQNGTKSKPLNIHNGLCSKV